MLKQKRKKFDRRCGLKLTRQIATKNGLSRGSVTEEPKGVNLLDPILVDRHFIVIKGMDILRLNVFKWTHSVKVTFKPDCYDEYSSKNKAPDVPEPVEDVPEHIEDTVQAYPAKKTRKCKKKQA